jgi:phage I-like protein
MSEPEERPYAGVQEEQNEEVIQEGAEAKVEQEAMGEEAIRSKEEEEEQETVAKEKVSEQEEEEKVKVTQTQKKKMAPWSRIKDEKSRITGISKQLEKQTYYLTRLEQVLQPLRKLGKTFDVQSKIVKEINISVKQLERQIIQIQKAIKKGKTRKK